MGNYSDPFAILNDQKRREREAILNGPQPSSAGALLNVISRRDYFAAAALPALIINHARNPDGLMIARDAAVIAHLLIKELGGSVAEQEEKA